MSMTRPPTIKKSSEGRTVAVVGDVYRFLATGDNTLGTYGLWEAIDPPGGGPPPHVHSREEERFYILEGEITVQSGDKRIVATETDDGCRLSESLVNNPVRRTSRRSPVGANPVRPVGRSAGGSQSDEGPDSLRQQVINASHWSTSD
jgi:hypothetical protein